MELSPQYTLWMSLITCVFLLKVNSERSTRVVWSCLARGRYMWPSKPLRRATRRSRGGTSSQRHLLWASLTTQTSSAWRGSWPKAVQSWLSLNLWRMERLTPSFGWVIPMNQMYSSWSDTFPAWVGCLHHVAQNLIGNKLSLLSY